MASGCSTSDGDRVDRGRPEVSGHTARIELATLDDGAFVVAWRAVSADSHPIDGSTTFTVGSGARALDDSVVAALVGSDDGPWRVAATVARGVGLLGLLLAVGLGTFLAFAHDGGDEAGRLRRLQRVAAGLAALGLLVEVPLRAALATGRGPGSVLDEGVLGQVLADRVGLTLGLAGLALLFAVVDGGRDRLSSAGAAIAVGIALALSGHTAATSPWLVAVGADAAHVVAASVWFGGIVGCLVGGHRAPPGGRRVGGGRGPLLPPRRRRPARRGHRRGRPRVDPGAQRRRPPHHHLRAAADRQGGARRGRRRPRRHQPLPRRPRPRRLRAGDPSPSRSPGCCAAPSPPRPWCS